MKRIANVTRLQMNKPDVTFLVPAVIVGMVLIVSAIISIALQRAGMDPADPEFAAGARGNMGMVFSLPGFLVYYGVQAVATTFPFALALGSTRRDYVFGTALANLITSLYVGTIMVLLLFIELGTNHWFFNVYALDNHAMGAGNAWVLFVTVFLGTFASTSIGGLFGAVWVRFGSKGPTVLGLVLALVLAVLLLLFVPHFAAIIEAVTRPLLASIAIGISLVAIAGTWGAMRRTAVR